MCREKQADDDDEETGQFLGLAHCFDKLLKLDAIERLGYCVGTHSFCWTVYELYFAKCNSIANVVILNVNAFCCAE